MKFVIIGSGPAGVIAAETIRAKLPDATIEMITKDPVPALSPVMLTYWASGKFEKKDVSFRSDNWAGRYGINLLTGTSVTHILPEEHRVLLGDGRPVSFDRLLIASGATALSLPIPGSAAKGVGFFRNFNDTELFLADRFKIETAAIIGGGFIGMKLACHLRERGLSVVILEKEDRLAARILDHGSSQMIAVKLRQHDIQVETGVVIEKILKQNGRVHALVLEGGRRILAQRVVLAAGVKPATNFVDPEDIRLDGGIVVNDRMETSCRGIYAAGDVAATQDSITGKWINNAIWPAATRQGSIAGYNMAGTGKRYRHNFPLNALELFGMRVMSAGYPMARDGDDVSVDQNPEKGEYFKQVIRNGRLSGFIMIGEIAQAGNCLQLMKKNSPLTGDARKKETVVDRRLPKGFGYAHGRIFR